MWHACKPNLYVYPRMMDSKPGGSALVMQAICNVQCMVSASYTILCWTLSML